MNLYRSLGIVLVVTAFFSIAGKAFASRLEPVSRFQNAELEAWHLYANGVYDDLVRQHPNVGIWPMKSRVGIVALTEGEELEATVGQTAHFARAVYYPEHEQIIEFYISHFDRYVEDGEQGGLDFQVNRDVENGLWAREGLDDEVEMLASTADIAYWQSTHKTEFLARLRVLMLKRDRYQVYLTSEATSGRGCDSLRIVDLKHLEVSETSLCNSSPD